MSAISTSFSFCNICMCICVLLIYKVLYLYKLFFVITWSSLITAQISWNRRQLGVYPYTVYCVTSNFCDWIQKCTVICDSSYYVPLIVASSSENYGRRKKCSVPSHGGTAVAQWLRCCTTNQRVAGPIPDGVTGIFHWHNPSDCTMALGLT